MKLELPGMNALVCGASQGIGRASALRLAEMGMNVAIAARNKESLEEALRMLPNGGSSNHKAIVADFSDSESAASIIAEELADWKSVSVLVNNAGGPPPGTALTARPEDFIRAFESHLIMNQRLVQHFADGMKKDGFGRIINIISISVKQPIENLGVSNTLRGAVASWSKTLSHELAPYGITVNNVLPGHTMTGRLEWLIRENAAREGMTIEEYRQRMIRDVPAGRFGKPEEVAAAVAFFASKQAGFITGVNLPVDGGYLKCI